MKGPSFRQIMLAATAMGTVVATPAYAQSAGREDVGDIVVTARRVEEKLQDVPISITVFNQEALSNRNIVNTGDLGTYTPSLSTNSRYGPEKASFAIRGFQQDLATQPSVGVYFADVVGLRSGGSTTGGNGVGVGNLFDLQNVQVLKGPQGTLFGRNTTGGAVLLVPRKPTDNLEGYIEGSAGNYDMWRVQGVLNLPLSDTFKVRLGVDHMDRDGYLRNHSGVGPDRLGNVNFTAARLSIVANLTPDLENYTIATYSRSDNDGFALRQVGCNDGTITGPVPATQGGPTGTATLACLQLARQKARGDGWWDVENSQPNPRMFAESWQIINTTTWVASDTLTIKNIASYGEYRELARFELYGDNQIDANGVFVRQLTGLGNTPNFDMASQNTYTEELQFQGRSEDGKLTWQAGGYFENSDPLGFTSQSTVIGLNCSDSLTYQCRAAPAANFDRLLGLPTPTVGNVFSSTISQPYQKTWFRNRGLYAQATYNFTEQLSLTGGFRYTWDRMTHRYDGTAIGFPANNTPLAFCSNTVRVRYPAGTSSPVNPGLPFPVVLPAPGVNHDLCNVTFTAKSNKPTWLLGLDFKPTSDLLFYAKWARGYRAGGVASANIYFEQWEPEKVDTYEVGAKTSFHANKFRGYFNVAGFYNDFRNQQIQETLVRALSSPLLGGSAIINAGKSRIWGIEVDTSATLFDQLRLEGGYTYLNTKLLSLTPVVLTPEQRLVWQAVVPTAQVGGPLALSPKHRFTVTGTYTLPLDESIGRISFGATYTYSSSQVASRATPARWGILPSQKLLNFNASWTDIMGKPIDLSFFMTNATNEEFPINVANAYTSYGYEAQNVNEPRMWGFRLKYRFGS